MEVYGTRQNTVAVCTRSFSYRSALSCIDARHRSSVNDVSRLENACRTIVRHAPGAATFESRTILFHVAKVRDFLQ